MKIRSLRSAVPRLSILLVAAVPAVGAAAGDGLPSARATFHSLQTPSFRVVGDVSPRRVGEIAEGLERFRAALARLKPKAPAGTSVPILVLPFSNDRAVRPYLYVDGQPAREFSAVFVPTRWGNYLVFDSSAGDEPLASVYSGFIHFFIGEYYPSAPLWLRRGLAEYYETFETTSNAIEVGRPHESHLRRLSRGWRIPLERLVAIDRESPEYRDPDRLGEYSAHCWALVHYLIVGDRELETQLPALLDRLDRGEPLDAALLASTGFGAAELEKRLKLYATRPIFPYLSWKVGELRVPELGAPVELGRGEALTLLGEYLAHAEVPEPARAHLDAALALEPESGDALALVGHLEEVSGRAEAADVLYKRSMAGRMRRVVSALHAGRFALERARVSGAGNEAGKVQLEAARAAAKRALELDPESGEAYALDGVVALEAGDASSALVALTHAQNRLPGRVDVVYDRWRAAVELGQTAIARGIATGPLARLDRQQAARALRYLEERGQSEAANRVGDEVQRAVAEKRYDDALAAARDGVAKATDPRIKAGLAEELATLETWVAGQRRVDTYNRTIELANAGKYEEAAAGLDALLADCPETASVCDAARDLRTQIEEFSKRRR